MNTPVWKFLYTLRENGGKENLSIPDSLHETDEDIIAAFIKNFYGANPSSVPKEIILPILPQESLLLTAWLSKLRNGDVKIYVPERGFKRRLKDMAQSNAAKYLADKNYNGNIRMPVNKAP